jgi:hypothetical protein
MDSHQRSKAMRDLLALTARPEIASMARQLFGSPVAPTAAKENKESPWRQIFAHWIFGIIVAGGVSYQGTDEVWIRCSVLAGLCLWLIVDSWAILRGTRNRNLFGSLLTTFLVAIFSVSGYGIFMHDRDSQKQDALLGLTITEAHQPDANKPFSAEFLIVNNSRISMPTTRARCEINDMLFADGGQFDHTTVFSPPQVYESPLRAGGDGETYKCPALEHWLSIDSSLVCADVSVHVDYGLPFQKQGTTPEEKSMRLVTKKESDGFRWHQQNLTLPWGACTGVKI